MQRYSGLDRFRVLGYSLNDSIRFRMLVARALGVKSTRVDGIIMGEHTHNLVFLFSSITVDGKSVSLTDEVKQSIRQGIPATMKAYDKLQAGRTTGWTTAIGLVSMVAAVCRDTGEVIPCSIVLDGEYGCRNLSMGVPAILGKGGVKQIVKLKLAPDEERELERSINGLEVTARFVDGTL